MKKDFLSITDAAAKGLLEILYLAKDLKEKHIQSGKTEEILKNKTLAMIFEKPSLRTRLSFEVAMTQLGGHAVNFGPSDIGLGTREPIKDVAKVTGSMADIIMARTFKHSTIMDLATHADVPVINALSDLEHPCQILADLLTIYEKKGTLAGLRIAFIGDGNNNVTHSLALACGLLGMHFTAASPKGYEMDMKVAYKAFLLGKEKNVIVTQSHNACEAAYQADIIYTDTWVSMGNEEEKAERLKVFDQYQVTFEIMNLAKKDAIFMHDMPAYRGNEVAEDVIDGPQSVIYQQAENRLHAQKALLINLLRK